MIHILGCGIARFDALWNPLVHLLPEVLQRRFDSIHYFRNIKSYLTSEGFHVEHSDVPFAASVAERARVLKINIETIQKKYPGERIHVVGHSMCGLDVRWAIAILGVDVAVVSTIGTPHLGTSLADKVLKRGYTRIVKDLRPFINLAGFLDLTAEACRTFNNNALEVESANATHYRTYGAAQELSGVFTPLRESWKLVNQIEGATDGLVSLKSQLWATEVGTKKIDQHTILTPLDHFNECGWWDRREVDNRKHFEQGVKEIYRDIVASAERL